ncbi:hypothetical protein VITFI_CDS0139 [Vitreoscilla filiformis]|uniref:2Fe-2S ferredoxin-type domain-containing protein n=2 Tax=Vitreoscilla filiformis TaxID=63 RepID=A0A221KA75_VITFI|nr:hypothetical protein VITFI_CDS0139 [Vitreoscilla filiformis]
MHALVVMSSAASPTVTHVAATGAVTHALLRPGESLLDALLRQGAEVMFSCRGGVCQVCLLHSTAGSVPAAAQQGLAPGLVQAGYLMACQCHPDADLVVHQPHPEAVHAARHQAPEQALPTPDPALWEELGQGRQVRRALEDFYATVFADAQLAPFFQHVTPERVIGQQYAFLCLLMTGEKIYFGERPRNAHHWMVISDALMDHRQALMRAALVRQGLTPDQIARWTRLEEHWRADMVKRVPIAKIQHGQVFPLDGFAREILSCGSLCDHCGAEIAEGTEVLYHRRLGTVSCPACSAF